MIYTLLARLMLTATLVSSLGLAAFAQTQTETAAIAAAAETSPETEGAETQPDETEGEEGESDTELVEEPLIRAGDMLHLKSGQVLSDVQILRSTPRFYEVQFVDGLTMEVPRSQVESVELDTIDPLDLRRDQRNSPESPANSVQGMEVGPELNEKLEQPASDTPLRYLDQDIITILENLTRRKSVAFEVDESVRALPIEERLVDLDVNPSLTFSVLFLERLPMVLPGLVVVYEQDKVRLVTRAVAQQQQAPTPGNPAAGQPGAANPQQLPPPAPQTPPGAPADVDAPTQPAQGDAPTAIPNPTPPPDPTPDAGTATPN